MSDLSKNQSSQSHTPWPRWKYQQQLVTLHSGCSSDAVGDDDHDDEDACDEEDDYDGGDGDDEVLDEDER